jgi:hypothetical protein
LTLASISAMPCGGVEVARGTLALQKYLGS